MPSQTSKTNENINNLLIIRICDGSYNHEDLISFVNLCTSLSAAWVKNELYYNRLNFPIVFENDNDLYVVSSIQNDQLFNIEKSSK